MRWSLSLLGLALVATSSFAAPKITAENYDKLKALIKASPNEEAWANIPWRIDLWEARAEAARVGKPILLWEMDGHPLGCT